MADSQTLETGDILLFHGSGWLDWLIQLFGHSYYCHVAIVLKDPTFIKDSNGNGLTGLYVMESGFEGIGDAEDKIKLGVQIGKFEDVIKGPLFDTVYVRHLDCSRNDAFTRNWSRYTVIPKISHMISGLLIG